MKFAFLAGAMALALLASPATAQTLLPQCRNAAGSYIACGSAVLVDKTGTALDGTNPLPTTPGPLAPASSAPLSGSFTTTMVTPTSGAATITGGVVTAGPFTPHAGRDILVQLKGANTGPAQIFTSDDSCATLDALTIGGAVSPLSQWASAPVNEVADTASAISNRLYCLRFTPNGAGTYTVRN